MRTGFTRRTDRLSPAEVESLRAMTPGHTVDHPDAWVAPILFASPHSGSIYPQAFRERALLGKAQLRRNEDMFVDRLIAAAVPAGAPRLCAHFPRCYVDVNRAPDDLPQSWSDRPIDPSARAQAGIGVVPTHIGDRAPIYRRIPSRADVEARIAALYHPYHAALQALIGQSCARFGQALLIDCHSMPGFAPMGSRRPDIVLGDRFGRACHADTLLQVRQVLQDAGFSVAVNYPYAGGYVTDHYGRPDSGIETLQIEINRDLYLNPVTLAPKRSYDDLAGRMAQVVQTLIDQRRPQAIAAQ
ncbi:N-formylglutamate amidohydrolase [Algimonas porphyrae]|uniref:N-formylglutamate amidohydrolase n=1 Tax=Algimonas porphyrae TaxID=1128113 RepID=A0ABQ5V4J5_9PROT|nr:N-formylglutamate amidohydrolase [Algimonas porphyrae]GLQ21202.1 N-formylglutamate amidohydrolase [Algimonas porphyrae]